MKRLLLFLTTAVLFTAAIYAQQKYPYAAPHQDTIWYYVDLNRSGITITYPCTYSSSINFIWLGHTKPSGRLTIPDSIRHNDTAYAVVAIDQSAFQSCQGLRRVSLPSTVKSIGAYAFANCLFDTIILPEGLQSIGVSAFLGNDSVQYVFLPSTLRFVASGFRYQPNRTPYQYRFGGTLVDWCKINFTDNRYNPIYETGKLPVQQLLDNTLEIPEGVDTILSHSFCGLPRVNTLRLPSSLRYIGSSAFASCNALRSVQFDTACQQLVIGARAFQGCVALTSIILPAGLHSVGESAFSGCGGLLGVDYMGTLSQWCRITFANQFSNPTAACRTLFIRGELLTEVRGLQGVTAINSFSFYNINTIRTIELNDSISSIGRYAFAVCTNVRNITLGHALNQIQLYAFLDCDNIEKVWLRCEQVPTVEHGISFYIDPNRGYRGPFNFDSIPHSVFVASCNMIDTFRIDPEWGNAPQWTHDVLTSYSTDWTVHACDNYTWRNGRTYTADNHSDTIHIASATECDTLYHLQLTIHHPQNSSASDTICANSLPYHYGDSLLRMGGAHDVVMHDMHGCDSTVHLDLYTHPTHVQNDDVHTCASMLPLMLHGRSFAESDTSGVYQIVLSDTNGCDSIVNLQLVINASVPTTLCAVGVDEEGVRLHWQQQPHAQSYVLYRGSNTSSLQRLTTVEDGRTNSWTDTQVDVNNNKYFYRIGVVDSCDNESTQSGDVQTMLLQGERDDIGFTRLLWNHPLSRNFEHYFILRGTSPLSMERIDELHANTSCEYVDYTAPAATDLYYCIEIDEPTCDEEQPQSAIRSNIFSTSQLGIHDGADRPEWLRVEGRSITIDNKEGDDVLVCDVAGRVLLQSTQSQLRHEAATAGVYFVKQGKNRVRKVVVAF